MVEMLSGDILRLAKGEKRQSKSVDLDKIQGLNFCDVFTGQKVILAGQNLRLNDAD